MLTRQHLLTRTRCALVALGVTAAALVAGRALVGGVTAPVPTVDEALVRLCLLALVGAGCWAWLATLSVVCEAWRGRPALRGLARPLRRVVLLLCGVALVAPTVTASADEHPHPRPGIAGLPLPDRATGPAHSQPDRDASTARPPAPPTVVVRAGDCLWRLAAADLPAAAGPARVAARWRAIYRLNAAVIGPDPDLIHPGQHLLLPPR